MEAQEFAATARGQYLADLPEPDIAPPVPFDQTERAKLQKASAAEVAPVTFYNEDGEKYVSTDPGEINRLRLSRTHFVSPEAAADPLLEDDHRFHPGESGVTVDDVLRHLTEHPEDIERVIDEERAGKNRSTILDVFGG